MFCPATTQKNELIRLNQQWWQNMCETRCHDVFFWCCLVQSWIFGLGFASQILILQVFETTAPVQTNLLCLWNGQRCWQKYHAFRFWHSSAFSWLQCFWHYRMTFQHQAILPWVVHTPKAGQTIGKKHFYNLVLNVHIIQFQVGAPICQKCLGLQEKWSMNSKSFADSNLFVLPGIRWTGGFI